jgi:D-xylonolactonase
MSPELISRGHGLLEAPIFDATLGLLYTDAHAGGVWRYRPDAPPELVVAHRRGIGGLARHADGGWIVSGRNVALKHAVTDADPDATMVYLESAPALGRTGYNDLVTDAAGRVYVGSLAYVPMLGQRGSGRTGQLHLIELSGESRVVAEGVHLSNGLGFSPDGRCLYHADSGAKLVYRYHVDADGSLANRSVFVRVSEGMPDGLAVAEDGSVWIAIVHAGSVLRYDAAGRLLQRIDLPVPMITSLCFGGDDWRDVFIVSGPERAAADLGGCIFHLRADVRGSPRHLARIARVLPDA